MEKQNFEEFQNFRHCKKILFLVFFTVLSLFLLVLTVSVIVGIDSKIKETRYIGQDIESQNTISVSATGEIYVKPDLALTTFSVVTEKKTVAEALSKNTEKMNKIIDSVKKQGVEEKDLKTTSFNIYPRYEWYEEKTGISPYPSGKRVLVGYEVSQSLQVKIRDMTKIGEIIQGATEAGANQVGDLQFTIDKEDEFKKQARGQAIEKAKEKAQGLASQLGVKLIRIKNFSESSVFPRYYGLEAVPAPAMGGGETPQIETGENKIEVTVSITYEIN